MEQRTIETSNSKKLLAALAVLIVVTVMALGVKLLSPKKSAITQAPTTTVPTTSQTNSTPATTTTTPATSQQYKDGTFKAIGNYTSPGGPESIQVSLTLKNGTVTDSTVQSGANDSEAQQFQNDFIQGYKTFVVGKSVDSIQLSNVSGSSLTPIGFNNALQQIKNQAKA